MIYQASVPPAGAVCGHQLCATPALVRVTFPPARFSTAAAVTSTGVWDSCDLHWPAFRDTTLRNGHHITDTTGDPRQILAEFPHWRIFRSDLGRLYASKPGTTVYGWLATQLRAEIRKRLAEDRPGDAP